MRMKPEARKADILAVALPMAARVGYLNVTRDGLAAAAKVSGPTLNYHFGTIAQLRRDLMRHAVKEKALAVIAQGLVARDPFALKAPQDLKQAAMAAACK